MASDNLKQVGRVIKETRNDVDFVLDRKLPFRVTVERIRDLFSPELPAEMVFTTEHDEQSVTVDLRFLKPPSPEAINVAYQGFCQAFAVDNTPQILQLAYEYESGSVRVYMNGTKYDSSKWYEYSSNEIYIAGGPHDLTNIVDICYEVTP